MPDKQLGFFGEATPLDQLGPREVRAGQRGGSAQAATIPDKPEGYAQILRWLSFGPMTDDTIAKMMADQHPGTMAKRRLRLERAGLVEDTGRTQATRRKVQAIVWRITDKGREVLKQWEQR